MDFIKTISRAIKPNPLGIEYSELVERNLHVLPQEFINEVLYWSRILGLGGLTHLKLQKLLYYCYAICLWNIKAVPFLPIVPNEDNLTTDVIEAGVHQRYDGNHIEFWQFGPVMPMAYAAFKNYGRTLLADSFFDYEKLFLRQEVDKTSNDLIGDIFKLQEGSRQNGIQASIKYALIALADMPANKLVEMTHSKNSAWHVFYEAKSERTDNEFILQKIVEEIYHYNFFEKEYEANKNRYEDE